MVITIQIRFGITKFRKDFSVCTAVAKALSAGYRRAEPHTGTSVCEHQNWSFFPSSLYSGSEVWEGFGFEPIWWSEISSRITLSLYISQHIPRQTIKRVVDLEQRFPTGVQVPQEIEVGHGYKIKFWGVKVDWVGATTQYVNLESFTNCEDFSQLMICLRSGPIFTTDVHRAESNEKSIYRFLSIELWFTIYGWHTWIFKCRRPKKIVC